MNPIEQKARRIDRLQAFYYTITRNMCYNQLAWCFIGIASARELEEHIQGA